MQGLKTRLWQRDLALTRLGAGIGSQFALHKLGNLLRTEDRRADADQRFYRQQARVLVDELGRLKGGVMKAGQLLALYGSYFLPADAVAILGELEDSTPAVEWRVVRPVLERAIGAVRMRELDIDERPLAAASLAQVHRARRRGDGLELALKIQYPGIAAAVDSDVATLRNLVRLARLAPRGVDLKPVFAEIRSMLHREVDYASERGFTESYARRLADDPRFVVPRVVTDYSGPGVLAMSFEPGAGVGTSMVRSLPSLRRTRLGRALVELVLREFFEWHCVQSDPHFGNYRIRLGEAEDGSLDRIVLLDFGAVRAYPTAFVEGYARIVRGAVERDPAQIAAGAVAVGLMDAGFPPEVRERFAALCELIVEPFNDHPRDGTPAALLNARGEYRWGASDLPKRIAHLAGRNMMSRWFRVPPPEMAFLHRRLTGVFALCAELRAEFNARPELLAALPPLETPP